MRQGLELDVEYVSRQSFRFDLWIIIKTVPVVLIARGVR
jgi:lipopolysaccharide/colanic/teichoic acid biosynthesis glycosyltransferase